MTALTVSTVRELLATGVKQEDLKYNHFAHVIVAGHISADTG